MMKSRRLLEFRLYSSRDGGDAGTRMVTVTPGYTRNTISNIARDLCSSDDLSYSFSDKGWVDCWEEQ
jgi:hypothetical protein